MCIATTKFVDNPHKDMKDLYNECNTEDCIDLCSSCEDIDRCQWINPLVKDVNSPESKSTPEIELYRVDENNQSRYGPTNVNVNEVVIEWDYTTLSTEYMIHYVEGTQINNNVNIIFTKQNYFNFSNNENDIDNLYILKKGATYLFKVYGLNINEPNTESNILKVSPK